LLLGMKLSITHHICSDDSFGKFGSHYLKREFYFDVRVPITELRY
jgi:dolichyl-phosphate-mannose--protein O-mannosyl transferase